MSGISSVFYAESYHPIQAGSIDGTDVLPHDNAVLRAHLCSSASLYDPFGDPNAVGDPYCTLFVARLSHQTTEHILHKAMSKYGRVKNLRLVRHIVTGASRGYAFVEFETEREMRRAYKDSNHSIIDDCEIMVDYNGQQLMPGWIPRRLGGGFGGKKESGQLRFGGRERPFRAPLRPIPYDELKKLGIPPPPEGKYMSRYQDPSPPRNEKCSEYRIGSKERYGQYRKRSPDRREDHWHMKSAIKHEEESAIKRKERSAIKREEESDRKREEKNASKREEHSKRVSINRGGDYTAQSSMERDRSSSASIERSEHYKRRRSRDKDELPHKRGHESCHRDRSHGTTSETEDR